MFLRLPGHIRLLFKALPFDVKHQRTLDIVSKIQIESLRHLDVHCLRFRDS